MPGRSQVLKLFRSCLLELKCHEELKKGALEHYSWQHSPVYEYLKRSILSSDSNDFVGLETYVMLLHGSRRSQELIAQYKGVGERSIEETARMVGLKLPKLYEDPNET